MSKEILLSNRYDYYNYLKYTCDNVWVLNLDKESPDSMRVIYQDTEMKKIEAIDPCGGPMITVGSIIPGVGKIRAISNTDGDWMVLVEGEDDKSIDSEITNNFLWENGFFLVYEYPSNEVISYWQNSKDSNMRLHVNENGYYISINSCVVEKNIKTKDQFFGAIEKLKK